MRSDCAFGDMKGVCDVFLNDMVEVAMIRKEISHITYLMAKF